MTISQALSWAGGVLSDARVPNAAEDAEWLLASLLGVGRLDLKVSGDKTLPDDDLEQFNAMIQRRKSREPLQYILGTQPFMGFEFAVSPDALIPRFDTETLCEQAVLRLGEGAQVLDLCTGTGAIGISISLLCPDAQVTCTDISPKALLLARKNAHALGAQVRLLQGDLFDALRGDEVFDMILSNPPYIPTADLPGLQQEVGYEPALALDGGGDGLDFYRRIIAQAPEFLKKGGLLGLEIGDGQAEAVTGLLQQDFRDIQLIRDLSGLDRVLFAALRKR